MREMVGGCCVCSDDRGWPENPLVYCDGQSCTVAVHQACYGIVTVPTGPWYCRKCESQERSVKVKCELCPSKYGALKRTDNSGWAHVVCALYIPEVRFGNVTTMEPIQLQLIPSERFNKVCYICEENGKPANATVGACMQCNKTGCKQQFHVTCAQGLGLLCEEAGNYLDNVKYCGYCQHHYSKLKKGGNVKTIPPYKPISSENHLSDSSSEKETETNATASAIKAPPSTNSSALPSQSMSSSSSKRKSSSGSKTTTSSSKSSSSNSSRSTSSSSHQKTIHSSSSKSEKPKVVNSNVKSAKSNEISAVTSVDSVEKTEKTLTINTSIKDVKIDSELLDSSKDSKEKSSKKRKSNSRTPTPISVVPSESGGLFGTVVHTAAELNSDVIGSGSSSVAPAVDKKDLLSSSNDSTDKPKKVKVDNTQSTIQANQPIVALTPLTATAVKSASPSTVITEAVTPVASQLTSINQSIIHSSTQPVNSLVVSVPLVNTTLSSQTHIINHQTNSVVTASSVFSHLNQEQNSSSDHKISTSTGGSNNQGNGMITSEMSGGGLKITYEKQVQVTNNLQVELERITPTAVEMPTKRSRSQSGDKNEKPGRSKKRSANGVNSQINSGAGSAPNSKRTSRSQHTTPPPHPAGVFASISQNRIKDSPPSSPSSESQGPPTAGRRTKGRKSAPANINTSSNNSKDSKDIKLFQNGVHAPHMLGNQLNPNSNMAQKMSDHLNSELEAHSIFNPTENSSNLVGPQLHHRVIASARASSASSSTASGGSGLSSMLGGGGGAIPQTLDQLLERQWEQGSQFLMEQAQHFDIASLLSCLHQLRAENLRLEEHVSSLLQRRDHLLAVNARLAIPLTGQPATPQSSHSHTVNNIHPAVAASHGDIPRSSRHGSGYSSHQQSSAQHSAAPIENGLPPEQTYQHRSPAASQPQPSPTVRHSPAGSGYPGSGLIRQGADTSGRSAPRPQQYPMYQGPGPSTQQQMVIRREADVHHQTSSKPS